MKLSDIEKVNHLVADLGEIQALIHMAEQADPPLFQLFIEAPGDSSLRMSKEGASTAHSGGVTVSEGFLDRLKELALGELRARRDVVLGELTALGVDTSTG